MPSTRTDTSNGKRALETSARTSTAFSGFALGANFSLAEDGSVRRLGLFLFLRLFTGAEELADHEEERPHDQEEQWLLERADVRALQCKGGEGEDDGYGCDGPMHDASCSPRTS